MPIKKNEVTLWVTRQFAVSQVVDWFTHGLVNLLKRLI